MDTPTEALAIQEVDWNRVREMYLQEKPLREIAIATGASVHAIRCRAWRHRWRDLTQDSSSSEPADPKELVAQWTMNMSLSVLGSSRMWANLEDKPETGRDAESWERARQLAIQSGRMLFGLDKDDRVHSWASGAPTIDITPLTKPGVDPTGNASGSERNA